MSFEPQCLATAIGSLPHADPSRACDVILENIPEIPIWPQLPKTNFREEMEIQYSEGLPCVVLDEARQKMHFETSGDSSRELEKFYESYLAANIEDFRITPAFSRGVYAMADRLKEKKPDALKLFKNQVTGPVTTALGRVDENKRAIYYNDVFRDVVVKGTEMKARWLLEKYRFLGCRQICFIDEPILSAFGSSTFVSVQRADVVQYLGDVVRVVQENGSLAGVHCCGNTEWTILVDSGVDIVSFDAYDFGETIAYYPKPMAEFLERGGVLAWGIVPTSEKVRTEEPDSLVKKLGAAVDNLAGKGISESLILDRCLVTPSCGTGSLSVELSEQIFNKLSKVSRLLRS